MQNKTRSYITYILMMLIFGVLIYFAIEGGDKFIDHGKALSTTGTDTSFLSTITRLIDENVKHQLSTLLIQIIVILATVRVFGFLFRYIGQPSVVGEIVAGIVLGPSLLGYFFPNAFNFVFPAESLTNLGLLSQIGLVLYMFAIGMELDFKILKTKINQTLVISHAGIVVPFFLGIVSAYFIYEKYAASNTLFLPFSLFIGISMSITAFPVLARIIQERKLTKSPLGTLALASAANDDVTAWCILAVVISIAQAGTFTGALFSIGLTIIYILVMFLVIRPLLKRIGKTYMNTEKINKTSISIIFLVMVVSATITEIIGIHALFGAFIAGVIMPPNFAFRKIMTDKVEDIALYVFLPLFFAYTGLRTEIGLLNSVDMWITCVGLIIVAIAGKLGGCTIASRLIGESWRDSLTIGTLMNTRGLMELVALNIGYEMGILPPSVFVILVIMALVTTFMTTPLLNLIKR